MPLKTKLAANTFFQLFGRGVSSLTTFIITIFIARYLGVETYGEFVKITTFVALFYLATDFGLNAITVRSLKQAESLSKQNNTAAPLSLLFSTRIVLSTTLAVLAALTAFLLPFSAASRSGFSPVVKWGIVLFAPSIIFQALTRSSNAYFQAHLRYDKAALAVVVGNLFNLLFVLSLVLFAHLTLFLAVTSFLAAATVQSLLSLLLLKKSVRTSLRIFSLNFSKTTALLKQGLPLGLTLLLNITFFRADTLLLALLRSSSEVGLYGLAYKFFEFPLTLPTFFMNSLYPLMTTILLHKRTHSRRQFKLLIKQAGVVLTITALGIIPIMWLLAPYILLIKNDFAGSVVLLRVLSLSLPFFFLTSLLMWTMVAQRRYWLLVKIYSMGLVVNLLLNIAFIPRYGALAAAFNTGITEFAILLFLASHLLSSS